MAELKLQKDCQLNCMLHIHELLTFITLLADGLLEYFFQRMRNGNETIKTNEIS